MSQPPRQARSLLERLVLGICLVCLLAFCANVVLGRLSVTQDWAGAWTLERVSEFLLLFATAVSFAVAALLAERRHAAHETGRPPPPAPAE